MATPEKRLIERSDVFLIVEFRPLRHAYEYSLGVTNNCSVEGLNFESHYHGLKRGDILEFNLKHPLSDVSVPAVGEVVWKKEAWYARVTGVKLRNMDQEGHERISALISSDHDMPVFPSIPEEKSVTGNDEVKPVNPEQNRAQKDKAIFDRLHLVNDIPPKFPGESIPGPVVSDNQGQCTTADHAAHNSATLHFTRAANMTYCQKFYPGNRAFHNGSPLRDMCNAVIANTLASLRDSDNRSWLPVPLAFLVAVIATIAFSMEFDFNRIEPKFSAVIVKTTQDESRALLSGYRHDETGMTSDQEVHISGKAEISDALCSESPGNTLPAPLEQFPDGGDTRGYKNYFVQVGAWKNFDYAKIMLAQLQKEYPETYIMPKDNFQIIMIPGLETETQGLTVSKSIKSKFDLDPLLILGDTYSPATENADEHDALQDDNNAVSTKQAGTQQQPSKPRLNISKQPRRNIQPKSAFKIMHPADTEDKIEAREALLSQKSSGNRKIHFKDPPETIHSPLRNKFLIRTMHRNPALIE
jgi:hypothetical protein